MTYITSCSRYGKENTKIETVSQYFLSYHFLSIPNKHTIDVKALIFLIGGKS